MSPAGRNSETGATLLELLVAMSVAAVLMVVLFQWTGRDSGSIEIRRQADLLASVLRQTRMDAITKNRSETFELDLQSRRYGQAGSQRHNTISVRIDVSAAIAGRPVDRTGKAAVAFYPDGGATAGRIRMSYGQATHIVSIDGLSGRVSVVRYR